MVLEKNTSELSEKFASLLKEDGLSSFAINNAVANYSRFIEGESTIISKNEIKAADGVLDYEDISNYKGFGEKALSKVAIINLNGGLGTGMGLSSAKSLLEVKEKTNFLDIIVKQVNFFRKKHNISLPLIFMNSFSTDEDTLKALGDFSNQNDIPLSFLQNKIRKIDLSTLEAVRYPEDPQLEWCPPGHGDIYGALFQNQIIKKLLNAGIEYAFISNVDNLGATLDLNILGYLSKTEAPFIMEVAERTEADKKGGHLARRKKDNVLLLREKAQCPDNETEEGGDFQNITKYSYFNTNSIWINLNFIQELLENNNGVITLPLIVNKKTVNPRDESSTPVAQLETAMGTAISLFDNSQAVCIDRSRFAPVKSTEDLIVLRSDRYLLNEDGTLSLNPDNIGGAGISVKLDSCYKKIDEFEKRFPKGIPSMINCESLTIQGDFIFEDDIQFIGHVHLVNSTGEQKIIPSGTILDGHHEF